MATDPNQQNVFITGSDLPEWATETTQQGILNAIKTGDSNNIKLTSNMNTLMGNLISIMAGDRNAAKTYRESIRKSQEESSEIRKQLSELKTGIQEASDNIAQGNDEDRSRDKKDEDRVKRQIVQINKLGLFDKFKFRSDMAMAKNQKEQFRVMNKYLGDISLSSKDLKDNLPEVLEKLGAPTSIAGGPGNDAFGGILALTGKTNVFKNLMDGAVAAYSASQVPFEMMMQQVKDRFEITTELRQSGLLEDLGASFVDTTKAFSDNTMTIVEATQFVREFSKAVGVTGTTAALEFVKKTAYATDIMDRYGVNFSQVAKISGTYLDTLERTGMLEQISTTERDRGMKSFMSAVEGVSMVLKTSLEESAKMIRDYLGRDDITAMLMTNSLNLSQEVITQIGAMAKMGPLGEIISKGAIDPNRFMLTPEFQALNNPALAGVRNIVEQMMSDLRSGRGTDELIAQYGKQMSNIISNDPLVAQLVAMDNDVASIVAGVGRLAQTSQDAINNINVPEVDQAERRRQDAERRRSAAVEGLYANTLKTLENSERLTEILNTQADLIDRQIGVVDRMAESTDIIAGILSLSATANEAVMKATVATAEMIVDMLPKDQKSIENATNASELSGMLKDQYADEQVRLGRIIERELGAEVKDLLDAKTSQEDTSYMPFYSGSNSDYLNQLRNTLQAGVIADSSGNQVTLDDNMRGYINAIIGQIQTEMSMGQVGGVSSNEVQFNNSLSNELDRRGFSLSELKDTLSSDTSTDQQKSDASAKIEESKSEVIIQQITTLAKNLSDSDGEFFDAEGKILSQTIKNLSEMSMTSPDKMREIIDSIRSNNDFKSYVGENFDTIISSLEQPYSTVSIPSTTSFVDIMQQGTQSSPDAIQSEIFNGIGEMVGDTTIQASSDKIKEFFGELQSDNQLTNADMIEKLERTLTAIENKKVEAAINTGTSDIANLVITLRELIRELK